MSSIKPLLPGELLARIRVTMWRYGLYLIMVWTGPRIGLKLSKRSGRRHARMGEIAGVRNGRTASGRRREHAD